MNLNKELEDKGEESNAEQSGDLSFSSCCLDAQNGQHVINQSSLEVYSERVPDADSMKMFVGQIPKDWTEEDCRQLLETYGAIHTLNILRDKETKKSKGCCFVTYYTRKAALDAQNDLHNLKKLPTCRNPIQMKPADNENKNDRKLFVGKLPKFMNETDVLALFANYGAIEECLVLRDANGVSKGCAFVTFSMRSNAASAIRALHHNKTFEGSTSPIVVKFAESNGKETKKMVNETISPVLQSLYQSPGTFASCIGAPTLLDQSYLNLIKIQQQQHQQQQQQQQQQQNLQMLSLPAQAYISPEMAYTSSILFGGGLAKLTSQPPPPPPQLIPNQPILSATASHLNGKKMITTADHTALSLASLSTLAQAIPHSFASLPPLAKFNTATPSASIGTNLKQLEGPDGANLFIYHLPAEYNDTDLVSLFSSFGNVISAKVFIDKNSNLSKCFGFVSFDNADSAQAAIRSMNGFQVLNKRLKVQLKKVFKRKIWRSMHTHLANVSLIGGGIYAAAAVTNCTSERNAVVNSTHSDIKFIWSFSVNTSSRALYSLIVDNSATVDELAPFIARNVSQPFSVAVAEYQQTVSTAGPFLITDQTGTNNDTYADLENIIGPKRDPFLAVFLMSIVYLLIMLTGTIGNLCTMYLISRKRYLHTATNYYLSSLAVSDLLLLLLGLPQDMVLLWQKYPYIFDESFCILRGWTSELSTNASILTITMFTIERFVAICYPLRRAATPKLGRVVKVIALCWCIAAICAAPIAMQFGIVYVLDSKQRPYPDSDHCAVKSLLYPYIFEIATMIFFVIPICIITILYILIGIRLRASSQNHRMQFNKNKNAGHQAKSRNCNKNGQIKQNRSESFEKRERPMSMSVRRQNASRQAVIKMLVAVVIAFFFCYSPFHAQRVLAIAMARNDVTDEGFIQIFTILTHISGVTYYLSATINPILYQLMSKKFQMALRETLPCCCKPFRDARNETVLAFSTAMTPSASPNAPSRAAPTATPITALTTPTIAIANTATAFSASSNQSSDSSSP